ncbi:MAG: hypothetical protein NZ891_05935, partial [bacterium]|nr:hypothetical protein [bacterium]MDW8164265.1 hypothetical protein [Candidatus Omnitrophota bacterium]
MINEPLKHVNVEVEVSSEESEKGIFYKTKEVTDARGFIHIRIPPKGWVDKEKEKSMKHVLSFQDIIRYDLELLKKEFKTIPTLKKIFISVWVHYELANLPKDIEKNFWELLRYLGINGIDRWDLGTVNFKEFFSEYNILSTTDILWPYVKLDWNEAETIEETIERVMDDYFKRLYEGRKKRLEEGETYMEYLVPHVYGNCTDEPGAATNAKRINETPKILNDFREYLKKNKLTPEFFGKKDWEEVFALDDRKQLKSEDIFDLHKNRLFYWTHKYIQHYTCLFWKGVTKAIHKYFKVEGVSPNFQAGPCRGGFLGNDNCVGVLGCTIDFHKLYRENVFTGMKLEDWTYGWDFGIG